MKTSSILGFIFVLVTVYFGAIAILPSQGAIFNGASIFLVLGGTFSAFLISFPANSLSRILNLLVKRSFSKPKVSQRLYVVRDLIVLSRLYSKNDATALKADLSHPFLREGFALTADKDVELNDLEYILWKRAEKFKKQNTSDQNILIALAKFPPAFGLLGSVTGIIAMLMNLGSAGKEVIGQGMAVALLTTFWGVAVTNMFILPLSDFTGRMNSEDSDLREIIVEGLLLIKEDTNSTVFSKKIQSFLTIQERIILKEINLNPKNHNIYTLTPDTNQEDERKHG